MGVGLTFGDVCPGLGASRRTHWSRRGTPAVLSVPDDDRRVKLAHKIVDDGLSVREAETLARLFAAGQTADRSARPVSPKSYKIVARKMRKLLGTNVRVRQTANKGKIEIDFQGEEELERLYRILSEGPTAAGEAPYGS